MKLLILVSFIASEVIGFDPTRHKNWHLLRHDICGQSVTMKIVGGQEAAMNSYPWMAQIGHNNYNTTQFRCGGVILTSRTVITAAHCIPQKKKELKSIVVRLGEHDVDENPDCTEDYCADPVVDVKPSEILIYKKFDIYTFKHDIAIIRLEKEIKFSDFIRPICLASGEMLKKNYTGSVTEVAGWGVEDVRSFKTSKKLRFAQLTVKPIGMCQKYLPSHLAIGPRQLCVGGDEGTDSCVGDSGGPLMRVDDGPNGPRYYYMGIVSFGSIYCGKKETPAVYTNVFSYTKWILDNLTTPKMNAITKY